MSRMTWQVIGKDGLGPMTLEKTLAIRCQVFPRGIGAGYGGQTPAAEQGEGELMPGGPG